MPPGSTNPNDNDRLRRGAEGRIYFEYDKDCSNGHVAVRLWIESQKSLELNF